MPASQAGRRGFDPRLPLFCLNSDPSTGSGQAYGIFSNYMIDNPNPKNPIHPINPGSDNFLIVRTDRLGDVLLTLPMERAIKESLPNARVTFLAREYTQPIVERCPDVDEVIVARKFRLRELHQLFRQSKADVAFFPAPRFPLALAAWLARIPIR